MGAQSLPDIFSTYADTAYAVQKEGKLADLVMIDLHRPNMQPENNLVKNLVYSGSKANVKMTMVNGKILYENGVFAEELQAGKIYQTCEEITRKLCDH